ncbi:MAG: hypothetical protein Q8S44_09080 [Flavobacteriaceae bacterium]|nr:hypothetical protein [Flavobacteriaceae bacterium]
MDWNKNKNRFIISLIVILLFSLNSNSQEFDAEKYRMLYNFKTVKQADNTRLLEVSFNARNNEDTKDIIPVFGAEIKFYSSLEEKEMLLGSSKTTKEGIAKLILPGNQKYLTNKDGNITLNARFEGSDKLSEESEEIIFKNVHLELDLKEIEGIKTAIATVYTINNLGEKIPVETDISLYVNSMFAKMKIGEGSITDGEFEYHFEFPTDLPGDINDNLTAYLMIEDHEEFGNVIQKKTAKWGVFHQHKKEKKLTLWSQYAPIWMYVVLTILLVGVWANYVYTIINLFKIKNEPDAFETKNIIRNT